VPTVFCKGDPLAAPGKQAYVVLTDKSGTKLVGLAKALAGKLPGFAPKLAETLGATARLEYVKYTEGDATVYAVPVLDAAGGAAIANVRRGLAAVLADCDATGNVQLSSTRVGAAPGGLEWLRMRRICEELGATHGLTWNVYEQFIRTPA
jgi:hypothetical protein